jgi:hypothetical protein
MLGKQRFYNLNHISSPFSFSLFFRWKSGISDHDYFTYASQVTGITHVHHHAPFFPYFHCFIFLWHDFFQVQSLSVMINRSTLYHMYLIHSSFICHKC